MFTSHSNALRPARLTNVHRVAFAQLPLLALLILVGGLASNFTAPPPANLAAPSAAAFVRHSDETATRPKPAAAEPKPAEVVKEKKAEEEQPKVRKEKGRKVRELRPGVAGDRDLEENFRGVCIPEESIFESILKNPEPITDVTPEPIRTIKDHVGGSKEDKTPKPEYVTTPTIQTEAKLTIACLERLHLLKKPFRDIKGEDILTDYFNNLDAWRLFFTGEQISAFKMRYGSTFDIYALQGNLTPAFSIYKNFLETLDKRIAWINKRLDQPFNLNSTESFISDRAAAKITWPLDSAAADRLWEQRLALDLILELLPDSKNKDSVASNAADDKSKSATDKDAGKDATGKKKPAAPVNIPDARDFFLPKGITAAQYADAIAAVRKRYSKIEMLWRFEPHEVEELYLNTIAAQYDPHTSFFSKQSLADFEIAMRNKLIGIGAMLNDVDGRCIIKEIIPGGPLEAANRAKVGDQIVAIGQGEDGEFTDVVGFRLNKIVSRLRGTEGTIVRIRLAPADDQTARYTISLKRAEIKLTTKLAKAAIYEVPTSDAAGAKTLKLGVIELPAFYGKDSTSGDVSSTSEDVAELIGKLKKRDIQGLVLDLRRNGGGYLDEAINLTSLFIPAKQTVVQVHGAFGDPEVRKTPDVLPTSPDTANILWDGPLVVLTSKLSASASEIVAGALKDHRRALIVGDECTHGKGSVQQLIPMDRLTNGRGDLGSAIKITIQKWYLPSGNSIQVKGVGADIVVSGAFSALPIGEGDLERPLAWDCIPTKFTPATLRVSVSNSLINTLTAASKKRQATLPEFIPLNRTINKTKKREKARAFPVNYDALLRERDDDKAFLKSIRAEYKKLVGSKFKTESIKLDAAIAQEKKEEAAKKAAAAAAAKPAAGSAPAGTTGSTTATGEAADDQDPNEDPASETTAESSSYLDVQRREALRILADWLRA